MRREKKHQIFTCTKYHLNTQEGLVMCVPMACIQNTNLFIKMFYLCLVLYSRTGACFVQQVNGIDFEDEIHFVERETILFYQEWLHKTVFDLVVGNWKEANENIVSEEIVLWSGMGKTEESMTNKIAFWEPTNKAILKTNNVARVIQMSCLKQSMHFFFQSNSLRSCYSVLVNYRWWANMLYRIEMF